MPMDSSFVGRSFAPTPPYLVGREKIREFAAAIGAGDPAHNDPAAARSMGHPDVVAPVTFPVVLTIPAIQQIIEDPALGADAERLVHGDQRFAYTRPVVAGDELTCASSIEEIISRGGHDFVTFRTDVATVAGEPVVSVWSRLVIRGEG
ncbi:MaoC family dehydratase N-terminal domain-containing protein [Solwaraspora sp. WMMD1047]|jgi:acyl dehydratase|uniref:MaoC family dehydratase N-terminal domain-containing protein n=1 Tax=Solwaraspora sp. WMMD1047 TaxID=3016102 RepID=UPI0024171794|nr:MaoC family dehydratase N-terminal domain-containing protein [Solwaraspora sp. WMMD1047]MDG4828398.1 MaoC family dehydratase N-terminal domain-containing protein [Solwaraspora sp. WMMD1047]